MGYTVNRLCYFFIAAAVCFIPGYGFICAQTYIPQLPANTQVTQTITIKNVSNDPQPADDEADYADEEMTDEEFEKELAKYLKEYEKQEQAEQAQKEQEAKTQQADGAKTNSPQKASAPKAKQQTVTQPGKFVPFFQAGGTAVNQEPLGGAPLAPRPSNYTKRGPGKRPGKGHNAHFKPINPKPVVRPVMVPGGNAAANPGSDPRLYMPPTGIKRPAVNPNPSHTRPNKTHK